MGCDRSAGCPDVAPSLTASTARSLGQRAPRDSTALPPRSTSSKILAESILGGLHHVLHSAGLAHNLERIFYAILRLKMGRFEIVATTSVEDAVRASNSRGQSDVRADRRLYAPFNGRAANSLAEGAQRDSTPRTWRLERFPVHALLVDREGQGNSLCSERPCWPRPSESATMSSECLRKKIKRRSASSALRHAPESI